MLLALRWVRCGRAVRRVRRERLSARTSNRRARATSVPLRCGGRRASQHFYPARIARAAPRFVRGGRTFGPSRLPWRLPWPRRRPRLQQHLQFPRTRAPDPAVRSRRACTIRARARARAQDCKIAEADNLGCRCVAAATIVAAGKQKRMPLRTVGRENEELSPHCVGVQLKTLVPPPDVDL